jgi:predicted amidohydrolase
MVHARMLSALSLVGILWFPGPAVADDVVEKPPKTVRVAACQAKRRSIDWRLATAAEALAAVDRNLAELEPLVHKAGDAKCDALSLPEDTLGLLDWVGMNAETAKTVLPEAVKRMNDRLGRAAAKHRMFLVTCSDLVEADGKTYNTAFFLGRNGKELGRYHKVCPTWGESGLRERGQEFPVIPTKDLGTVGMLICYDLVFPETARCLALQGADIVFFPTMGGAAVGDDDIGLQALRVRAAENQIYLVVAFRGNGAMIISPRGKILAKAEGADGLAIADIDPRGGREGGDASNQQKDMRARLFRERNPQAFRLLTETDAPVLAKVPIEISRKTRGGSLRGC